MMQAAPQPLFIICPGRTFSSVICAAIGQHPKLFGLPEVNLFGTDTVGALLDMDVPVLGVVGASNGVKRALAELTYGEQTEARVKEVEKFLLERRSWTGFQMFEELRRLAGNRGLVDKTPTNSAPAGLARLYAAYPDAYYLHIARHPRAYGRSRRKSKVFERFYDLDALEKSWVVRHRELLEFGLRLPARQYLYLKGEAFFETPEIWLKQICEWMGLTASATDIAAMMRTELSPFACEGPSNARLGNNPGFIESPALRVGKMAEENLDEPLDWYPDSDVYFSDETRMIANLLGYDR